jgi:NAD(P)H-dependent FMN reductase
MHEATERVLRYFDYEHLPANLAAYSKPFHDLAHVVANDLEGPEVTAGLRKLLEAKDCVVRAALDQEEKDHV